MAISTEQDKDIVLRQWYEELWNRWNICSALHSQTFSTRSMRWLPKEALWLPGGQCGALIEVSTISICYSNWVQSLLRHRRPS